MTQVPSLCWEDPLEEGMATHSSILAWEIPWTEEPDGLYSTQAHKDLDTTEVTEHSQVLDEHFQVTETIQGYKLTKESV